MARRPSISAGRPRNARPAILSSLKSLLETGKPLVVKLEPPKEMLEAVKRAVS